MVVEWRLSVYLSLFVGHRGHPHSDRGWLVPALGAGFL
jgi:hypothetical protein